MRVVSQIFAFVLVVVSLASPCLAEISVHQKSDDKGLSQTLLCGGPASHCYGHKLKAVMARSTNVEHAALALTSQDTGAIVFDRAADRYTGFSRVDVFALKALCKNGVDLHVLCRLLN